MKAVIVVERAEDLDQLKLEYPDVLIELRVDRDPRLLNMTEGILDRCILTLRSKSEGGDFIGNRMPIIKRMIDLKPRYVDLEYSHDLDYLDSDVDIILSRHDYSGTMEKRASAFLQELTTQGLQNADVLFKFVGKSVDTLDAILAHRLLSSELERTTVLSIERNGDILRILTDQYRQEIVYGSTRDGFLVHIESILQQPSLCIGLLGKSLSHSLSPIIHEIFWKQIQVSGYYFLLEAMNNNRALILLDEVSKFQGINVTFPYKSLAAQYCDEVDHDVKKTGSCNTIIFGKKVQGFNTDLFGIQKSLELLNISSKRALVYGSGDSARSVVNILSEMNCEITVVYRSKSRIKDFTDVQFLYMDEVHSTEGFDLFINATPLGLNDEEIPVLISSETKILDLVYRIKDTKLVATNGGIDGKHMLFFQAAMSFEKFTGRKIDIDSAYRMFMRWIDDQCRI